MKKASAIRSLAADNTYASIIVQPSIAQMRLCLCCRIQRAPLLIVLICLVQDLIRSSIFSVLTYVHGDMNLYCISNMLITLFSFGLIGQSLLIKNQLLTSNLTRIYSILRTPLLAINFLQLTYFIASVTALAWVGKQPASKLLGAVVLMVLVVHVEVYFLFMTTYLWRSANMLKEMDMSEREKYLNYNEIVSAG